MSSGADVPVEIQTQAPNVRGANRAYVRDFRIGRGDRCDVQVEASVVSRVHAEIVFEDGRWWVVDADSTNGTYLGGERIDRNPLPRNAELQLGTDGPTFLLSHTGPNEHNQTMGATTQEETIAGDEPAQAGSRSSEPESPTAPGSGSDPERPSGSVTQYVQHYFEDQERSAGEHTRLLRQAYQRVQQKERRQYVWVVAGALALCLVLGGYAVVQHLRNERLEDRARDVFSGMKEQDVLIAKLKRRIEESEDASLQEQLAALEKQQRRQRERYDGFVRELGVYRELSAKEREIYQVARIFGESEFGMPAGFVREVKETIEGYWKGPQGRPRLRAAIKRAEKHDYAGFIVRTMREHSLPPEFFYLALQESGLDVNAVGPRTRWGIAKGMWQFIPSTAREYGLRVGPRRDERTVDLQDERHDFEKSTRAAARYLREIYSTEAQASGLLVVASYNWGEHRVTDKLEHLPKGIPEQAVEDIPQNPDKRSYWRFLKEFSDRMPEETKDYVLKVFSAAVIGRNPDLFGFEFQNPLREHMNTAVPPTAVASPAGPTHSGDGAHPDDSQTASPTQPTSAL